MKNDSADYDTISPMVAVSAKSPQNLRNHVLATQRGSIYVEYFILALIVALATIAFWKGPGGFARARATVESAFDNSVNRVLAP